MSPPALAHSAYTGPVTAALPTMVELDDALASVLDAARSRGRLATRRCSAETIAAQLGPVFAAAELGARWSLPNAELSIMDGFAVRAADLVDRSTASLRCEADESAAGHRASASLEPGHAMRISTGAVLPAGADMVVPIEDTRPLEGDAGGIEVAEDACRRARPGRFVRARGSEIEAGQILVREGDAIGPGRLSALVATGYPQLEVFAAPKVAIVSTGDELVDPASYAESEDRQPAPGEVLRTNATMLAMQARRCGAEIIGPFWAGDTRAATRAAFEACAGADLILSSGGLSVGAHDHVWPVALEMGLVPSFRKVKLRPGKPTSFGRLGDAALLCLPGNPASAFVAFELFGRPYLDALRGAAAPGLPVVELPLREAIEPERSRVHFVRAQLVEGEAQPLRSQLSGALPSIAGAELLLRIDPGPATLRAGTRVKALRLPRADFA